MKKPVIDYDECIGCGSCVEVCPEVFAMKEEEGKVGTSAMRVTVRRRQVFALWKL